ncbi:MAG: cobalt-precorrin-5B (C(1))-methyltransferase CbiD [bacterium]
MSKKLRSGFTTGTCAAAAAAAAVEAYFGYPPLDVEVELPNKKKVTIEVHSVDIKPSRSKKAGASGEEIITKVRKDAGDDPDVTNGAIIGASLMMKEGGNDDVHIEGGKGVGKVTRPGLPVKVGQPAINPVPQKMIRQGILEAINRYRPPYDRYGGYTIFVTIFVENGEELARKTLNPRLGIVGGLSILGTTGIVKPFSAASYRETIEICLRSAKAVKPDKCVLSTGRGSEKRVEKILHDLPEASFVLIADFFAFSLKKAREEGFTDITLACFFGKLCKWALEMEYTHAHTQETSFERLADLAALGGLSGKFCDFVRGANTAREIYESAWPEKEEFISLIGERAHQAACNLAGRGITLYCFDFIGNGYKRWR